MPENGQNHAREALLEVLLSKVESENYPSSTILDVIESLLTPQDVPRYVDLLVDGVRDSQFPSISMIHRIQALA